MQDNIDTDFDAGGKVSVGLTATTIVSQWIWAATLLQSSAVGSKVIISYLDMFTVKVDLGTFSLIVFAF